VSNLDQVPDKTFSGLRSVEARARLDMEGANELPSPEHRTPSRIVREVLSEPMFALLIAAGAIYLVLGDLKEALVLLAFATGSVAIAVVQESRSERVLESLRDLTSPRALVIRDGVRSRIPGREVVRDDLIVLSEGDRVPADGELIAANDFMADESLLTGESVPVEKHANSDGTAATPDCLEKRATVFSGSLVVRGEGIARVHATGVRSEIGKIGQSLNAIAQEPPRLQVQTRRVVRLFGIIAAIVSALSILLYGLLRGSWLQAVLGGIAVGMSMLPEEFPLVLTVFMVMGAWRISQARVLTRRAAAIETLGSASVLCTDKTGTLTKNRMTVVALHSADMSWNRESGAELQDSVRELARIAALASAPEPADPMERAIHEIAGKPDAPRHALLKAYGLRPDLLAVSYVWADEDESTALVCSKGAPEAIAGLCKLPEDVLSDMRATVDMLAAMGTRVLAVASARVPRDRPVESQRDFPLMFLGLVGLVDPLRASVPAAVEECHTAGIRVIMITGDHPVTAKAIATAAGIRGGIVVTGAQISAMSDSELAASVRATNVFARVAPAQKLRIVEALKENGDIVAMTGDGVNDAPALKAAHIGIAMGSRGTDVAREASAIVLLDDDFASIVHAIRLGRRIYDNLQKAMEFIVAVHVPIAGLALLPLLLGLPLVLWPIHIAFLEMLIDPACSVVFEAEPEEAGVMRRPPRPSNSVLLSGRLMGWGFVQGLLVLFAVGLAFGFSQFRNMPEDEARALLFVSLILSNIALIFANRSFDASLLAALRGSNRSLQVLLGGVMGALALAVFVPAARSLFRFGPLHLDDLLVALTAAVLTLSVLELIKPWWRNAKLEAAVR
jgi:Ca2+-transporting ATPase